MTTVRLDPTTRAALERLAAQRGQSRSEVIRDAISHLAGEETEGTPCAFELLQPFAGIADSGGRELSRESGRRFREKLEEKRRASGPG
ncbi:MAG TPA: CopG family transcriptional regulator [Thermoanaerobaculia bacterium]|nr:CopG family transcriptional regulator [Thermoanaerobaculia bacterium]